MGGYVTRTGAQGRGDRCRPYPSRCGETREVTLLSQTLERILDSPKGVGAQPMRKHRYEGRQKVRPYAKTRRDGLGDASFRAVTAQFTSDCAHGVWAWIPVSSRLIEVATRAMGGLPKSISLRSADALHLACARDHGLRDVYTSDRHMSAAAPHFHVRVIAVGTR